MRLRVYTVPKSGGDQDFLHVSGFLLLIRNINCCPGSRFFVEFNSFATENNLVLSDLNRLNNVITYVSDDAVICIALLSAYDC